jgi:NADPH:quinone reductase-like Zn-dependent oxidoreductase
MKPLPSSMKAVVLTGHGNLDKLQYMDYPLPEVADDEVLIGFHRAQIDFMAKKYIGKLVVMPDRFYKAV